MKIQQLISFIIFITLSSCGGGGGGSIETNVEALTPKSYYLQGDPLSVIEGAKLEPSNFIHTGNLRSFGSFFIAGATDFTERQVESDSSEYSEPANQSSLERVMRSNFSFRQTHSSGDNDFYQYADRDETVILTFKNNPLKDKKLTLTSVQYAGQPPRKAKALHYSIKNDASAFSILYQTNLPGNEKTLSAIYFAQRQTPGSRIAQVLNRFYVYIFGPGVKVLWNNEVTISLCHNDPFMRNLYIRSMGAWTRTLKTENLKISAQQLEQYPPFSDLNSQCIYFVDNYRTTPVQEPYSNPGVNIMMLRPGTNNFMESDIFIWKKEVEKTGRGDFRHPFNSTSITRTLIHEIGHLLGLGHKFDGTPSIMSYDPRYTAPQQYDIQALEALYH